MDTAIRRSQTTTENLRVKEPTSFLKALQVGDYIEANKLLDEGADVRISFRSDQVWGAVTAGSPLTIILVSQPQSDDATAYATWRALVHRIIDLGADVNAEALDYDWRGCGDSTNAFKLVAD